MKPIIFFLLLTFIVYQGQSQTVIKMEKVNGVFVMPCKVNGLSLKFIFDTGASDVSISLTEALFMLKNGYLNENDLIGTEYYRIANGDIQEGTKIILKQIEVGKLKLYNVKASIVHSLSAPLLLGQSALSKLGKIEFNYADNTLTIKDGPNDYVYNDNSSQSNQSSNTYSSKKSYFGSDYKFITTFDNPPFAMPLREQPDVNSKEIYKCPKDATVYVVDDSGKTFYKVVVNGHTGYISKIHLKRN